MRNRRAKPGARCANFAKGLTWNRLAFGRARVVRLQSGARGNSLCRSSNSSRARNSYKAINIAELWHGVERASASHRARRQKYLEAIVAVLPIIAYTEETAYYHARLWSDLGTSGKIIGAYDLIVAATA